MGPRRNRLASDPGWCRVPERPLEALFREGALAWERLRSSRPVYRFTFGSRLPAVVGKFFTGGPGFTSVDRGLLKEYRVYRQAPAWGLNGSGCLPRLLGRYLPAGLGLLLEDIPGPDLDRYLAGAADAHGFRELCPKLEKLAGLLAFFHSRPVPSKPTSHRPGWRYFHKLLGQLQTAGLLSGEESEALKAAGSAWEMVLPQYPDTLVLVHGDATSTNFLFPENRAVAIDLERLGLGDRLLDLSWVAGEIKHAWGWRFHNFAGSEEAIGHFFRAYFEALEAGAALADRILRLNPFYMALAELRIARNGYLSWEYRRALIEEAGRCLVGGRRLA